MTDMKLEHGITGERMLDIARSMYDNAGAVSGDYPYYPQVRFAYDMFVASYIIAMEAHDIDFAEKSLSALRSCVDDMAEILGREDRLTNSGLGCYEGIDIEMENYVKELKEAK